MSYPPYVTLHARRPAARPAQRSTAGGPGGPGAGSAHGAGNAASAASAKPATHDISRVSYHVKNIGSFAETLEASAGRAFPNRGRSSQRYKKVQALLIHWTSDDLFVLPELEDLEKCLREDYFFETEIFAIPSENSHLELMMQIGKLIKEHEAEDTLFMIYYGGHAKIDDSRQSTWCATRNPDSSWLQWSAIQTLLERSRSDVLILLDCCAGAASATFPNGNSITETISASSWDAIAPDPGRYSFTNSIIEVLQEWRMRTFSAAMLHAEVLARLKHPRPIAWNGRMHEARATPVHFMMTSNHRAPSIEISRTLPGDRTPPSPVQELTADVAEVEAAEEAAEESAVSEPDDNTPHVMISLALEDDQQLNLNAWEQWLGNFPALAKYVKVQGVFKSHSTLLLLSLPVMIWDLLPENQATSFVAFIRSNNLAGNPAQVPPGRMPASVSERAPTSDGSSFTDRANYAAYGQYPAYQFDGTTFAPSSGTNLPGGRQLVGVPTPHGQHQHPGHAQLQRHASTPFSAPDAQAGGRASQPAPLRRVTSTTAVEETELQHRDGGSRAIGMRPILNQQRSAQRTIFADNVPECPKFAPHIEERLELYYRKEKQPNNAQREFIASNLGIEPLHIDVWFHHRAEKSRMMHKLRNLKLNEAKPATDEGATMILPAHLGQLLDISRPEQMLILDLRTAADYRRSHVHGAINMRIPVKFIQNAPLGLIEKAFADDESIAKFSRWRLSRSMVFYFKGVEFAWECPAADALLDRFRGEGWAGQCFVLKGHYREFSDSFPRYIAGAKMTDEAREWVKQLDKLPRLDQVRSKRVYMDWLAQLQSENTVRPSNANASRRTERLRAKEQHQRELEDDFLTSHPELYKAAAFESSPSPDLAAFEAAGSRRSKGKAARLDDDEDDEYDDDDDGDNFDAKAHMVEYLDSGLDKMREAAMGTATGPTSSGVSPSKLAVMDEYDGGPDAKRPPSDEFELLSGDEHLVAEQGFGKQGEMPPGGAGRGAGGLGGRRGQSHRPASSEQQSQGQQQQQQQQQQRKGWQRLNKVFHRA